MAEEKIVVVTSHGKLKVLLVFAGFFVLVCALGVLGWYLKQLHDTNARLANEVTQFRSLTETLVRSSTRWATKDDLQNSLKDLLTKDDRAALERDIRRVGAQLTAVGRTVGSLKQKVTKLQESDRIGPENPKVEKCDDGRLVDIHGYTKNPQVKELEDSNKAPVAQATFDASKKAPWGYEVYGRKYSLLTAVSTKDSGQMVFHHQLKYGVPGKSEKLYPIKLETSEYLQIPESDRMYWWNPRLDVSFFAGGKVYGFADGPGRSGELFSFGGDLGMSLSSYGKNKVDSMWRFFRFAAGYDADRQAAHLSFAPALFNLGRPIPVLTNLYLSPQIGIDSAGGVVVNVGAGFQL